MKAKIKFQKYDLAAIIFCIIILVLSLILGYFHKVGTFGVETDFYGSYGIQAENILSGKPYTYNVNPPGYPILVALFSILTEDFFVAGKILSALSISLFMFTCYFIFKKLFTERIAFVSIIFTGVILIPYSFLAATDMVGAAFATIPISLLINKDEKKSLTYLIIGITCGAAYLIRLDSIFVLIGITISILFVIHSDKWREKFIKTIILITGFVIITSPWFIYNWKFNGSPFATGAYDQVGYHLYNWNPDEDASIDKATSEQIVEQIIEKSESPEVLLIKPMQLLYNYLKNIPSRTKSYIINSAPFPLYLFLGGGIILFFKNLNRKKLTYFIIWLSGFLLMGFISFKLRHYFILIPFTSLLISYFLLRPEHFDISVKTNFFIVLIFIFSLFFLIKKSYRETMISYNAEPRYLLEAAEFLKSRSSKDDIIITRKPHIAYLSGLKNIFLYEYQTEDFYNKSKYVNARFLVYSDFEAELWEGLKFFSDPENVKDKFILIYDHEPTNTLIYEIK